MGLLDTEGTVFLRAWQIVTIVLVKSMGSDAAEAGGGGAGLLRKRDVVVAVLAVAALLVTVPAEYSYTMRPTWFHDQRSSTVAAGSAGAAGGGGAAAAATASSAHQESTPLPVVTDLDGDGANEVLLFSARKHALQLLAVPRDVTAAAAAGSSAAAELVVPRVVAEAPLLANVRVTTGKAPVALGTGYVDVYSEDTAREQVVVVLREDWVVMCFDSRLTLLWETPVTHHVDKSADLLAKFRFEEASIAVAPLTAVPQEQRGEEDGAAPHGGGEHGSGGLILVGASMRRKEHASSAAQHGAQLGDGHQEHDNAQDIELQAVLEHFSVYALDGKTGQLLWKHQGGALHATEDLLAPQHTFRLDDTGMRRHPFAADWSAFRHSIAKVLPHSWSTLDDTTVHFAHFERATGGHRPGHAAAGPGGRHAKRQGVNDHNMAHHQSHNRAQNHGRRGRRRREAAGTTDAEEKGGSGGLLQSSSHPHHLHAGDHPMWSILSHKLSSPNAHTAMQPHSSSEHIVDPNVVVIKSSKGVEVLALRSGVAITQLALPEGVVYDDVNGDGVIDAIHVVEALEKHGKHDLHMPSARGTAAAGSVAGMMGREVEIEEQEPGTHPLLPCSAVVLSGIPPREHLFNVSVCESGHALTEPLAHHSDKSRGHRPVHMSRPLVLRKHEQPGNPHRGVSPHHDVIFGVHKGVLTSVNHHGRQNWQLSHGPRWGQGSVSAVVHYHHDAALVTEAGTANVPDADILVVGNRKMHIVSAHYGSEHEAVVIPQPPVRAPVLGDFDNDGITDVILLSADATWGFSVQKNPRPQMMLVLAVVMVAIAAVVFLVNMESAIPALSGAGADASGAGGDGARSGAKFVVYRSTDD